MKVVQLRCKRKGHVFFVRLTKLNPDLWHWPNGKRRTPDFCPFDDSRFVEEIRE